MLTAAQRRQLSRRTTATSRARLRSRFQGPTFMRGKQGMRDTLTGFPVGGAPTFTRGMTGMHDTLTGQPYRSGTPAAPRPGVPPQAPQSGVPRQTAQFMPDAQYLAQAAQSQFERQQRLNELQAEGEAQRNATQEAIRQLTQAAPEQRQGITQNAARQGLFYSGVLGKRLGDYETQLARTRAGVQSRFDVQQRAREAARTAILQGAPLEEAAARAAAIERQIQRDSTAASNNQLVPTPQPKATIPKPKPKPKPKARRRRRK